MTKKKSRQDYLAACLIKLVANYSLLKTIVASVVPRGLSL